MQGLDKRLTFYNAVKDKKLEKVLAYKTSNLIFALLLKTKDDSVAQLVEQYTFNVWALGSSPSGITNLATQNNSNRSKAPQILTLRGFLFLEHCQKKPKKPTF